jgi:hypothetical protein
VTKGCRVGRERVGIEVKRPCNCPVSIAPGVIAKTSVSILPSAVVVVGFLRVGWEGMGVCDGRSAALVASARGTSRSLMDLYSVIVPRFPPACVSIHIPFHALPAVLAHDHTCDPTHRIDTLRRSLDTADHIRAQTLSQPRLALRRIGRRRGDTRYSASRGLSRNVRRTHAVRKAAKEARPGRMFLRLVVGGCGVAVVVAGEGAGDGHGAVAHGCHDAALAFALELRCDDVRELFAEEAAADVDDEPGDGDGVPDAHEDEEQGLLEAGELGEVDGGEAGYGHGADAVEEGVDEGDGVEAIGGVEDGGGDERGEREEENMESIILLAFRTGGTLSGRTGKS